MGKDDKVKRIFFTKIYPWLPYLPWEGPPVPKVVMDGFLAGLLGDDSFLRWRRTVEQYKEK